MVSSNLANSGAGAGESVNVIQSYSFGPDASLLVAEYGIYKELGLKQQDVTDVLSKFWLSDVHIHAAGILFKKQYPNYPMQLDIHRCKANVYACHNTMQIHHDGVNHWLLSSIISDTVVVYGSIYKAPHRKEVKNLLFLFYESFVVDNKLVIKYADVMKQVGSNDCGLFCIAYTVDLAEGNDPLDIEYDQSYMRWHLVQCFKKGKLAIFPRNSRNLNSRRDTYTQTIVVVSL